MQSQLIISNFTKFQLFQVYKIDNYFEQYLLTQVKPYPLSCLVTKWVLNLISYNTKVKTQNFTWAERTQKQEPTDEVTIVAQVRKWC